MRKIKHWTKEELDILKKHYANSTHTELVDMLGCDRALISRKANSLGLYKSKKIMKKVMFQNGQPSWNKGRKVKDYCSPEAIERMAKTRFKKGNRPHNTRPVGSSVMHADGYMYLKVEEPNVLVQEHRHLWEQHHGPIPEGDNIQFKDGDRTNIVIDNLYKISREDQMIENSGTINLTDNMVAHYLAGNRKANQEVKKEMLRHPQLINAKRQQILLTRQIREYE